MDYNRLGKTDLVVSAVGLGCVTFGREIDEATSFAVMDHATEQGLTFLDTAEAYSAGESERVVGKWLRERRARDRIVLATKVSGSLTRQRVVASAEASLGRLQTDRVDLFYLHRWDPDVPLDETLRALQDIVEQGKARHVACSNYVAASLRQALALQDSNAWARMACVQSNYNLVTREIEEEMLPLCVREGMGLVTYSPLGAGFLTGKYRRDGPVPAGTRFDVIPGHQSIYFDARKFETVERLRAKADALGTTPIALALAWVFGQRAITSVLIGARDKRHIDQAIEARRVPLGPDQREELGRF